MNPKHYGYTLIATAAVWAWHRTRQATHQLSRIADWAEQKAWNQ